MKPFLQWTAGLLLSLFLPISLLAQTIKLEGIIGMEGGELYNYDVIATKTDRPHHYKGTAKTHVFKGQEFSVEVEFTVNPLDNSMDFRETKIVGETGFKSNITVCLVEALLQYDPQTGILKGDINKDVENKTAYCAIGKLTFMNKNGLDPIFKPKSEKTESTPIVATPAQVKDNKAKPSSPPKRIEAPSTPTVVRRTPNPNSTKQVTEGKAITLQWKSEKILLEIWDDNNLDDDIISVFYNNKEVLSNYKLTKESKKLTFDIAGSELNIITIKAMNNGSEPPNTAMLLLHDGDKEHKITAHNDAGKSAIIKIVKNID